MKPKIPRGWRKLGHHETIQKGDKFWSASSEMFVGSVNWKRKKGSRPCDNVLVLFYIRKLNASIK